MSFNGSNSTDSDGSIGRYDWDFGDSTIANNAGPTPTHVYETGGKYIARLTVTDDSEETDMDITVVNVGIGNLPPLAHAGDSVSGKVSRDITFDGTGSSDPDGSVANYAWSFGDGNTGTGPNPTHSYAAAGKYFVTLTVTDNDGATNSDATLVDAEQESGGDGISGGDNRIAIDSVENDTVVQDNVLQGPGNIVVKGRTVEGSTVIIYSNTMTNGDIR